MYNMNNEDRVYQRRAEGVGSLRRERCGGKVWGLGNERPKNFICRGCQLAPRVRQDNARPVAQLKVNPVACHRGLI